MTHPIDGLVGSRSVEEANSALRKNGAIEIPMPTYGYLRGRQLTHGKLGYDLHNLWEGKDLYEMIYVDRFGGNNSELAFFRQEGVCSCRYHMRYTRGITEKGDIG